VQATGKKSVGKDNEGEMRQEKTEWWYSKQNWN